MISHKKKLKRADKRGVAVYIVTYVGSVMTPQLLFRADMRM